jgi:isocitrate/isopropylmalate dehydrogenase
MKIAVLPGDGIGPEIIKQAVKVLKSLSRDGLTIEMQEAPIGGAGHDAAQDPLPQKTLALAKRRMPCCWVRSVARSTIRCQGRCALNRDCCASARNSACLPI